MVKLSIIIPVYNVEKFIERCIRSIRRQKVSDYEILLVDDASTDQTMSIVKELQKEVPQLQVFEQAHAGQAKARNLALTYAKGQYVTFIDGDDYWEEDHLEKLFELLDQNDVDLAIGNQYFVDENGKNIACQCIDHTVSSVGGPEILVQEKVIIGAMWLAVCKRAMIEENHIRFAEEYVCNEDFDFVMQCMIHTNTAVFIDWPFYHYFRDNDNSTYKLMSGEKIKIYMKVCRKWFDYYITHKQDYDYSDNVLYAITEHARWTIGQIIYFPRSNSFYQELYNYLVSSYYVFGLESEKSFKYMLRKRRIYTRIHKIGHEVKRAWKRQDKQDLEK